MNYISIRIVTLLFISLLSSCSGKGNPVTRVVSDFTSVIPIQMARISHTETYTQKFDITSFLENTSSSDKEKNAKIDEHMDDVFISLLGGKNWQYLKDLYGSESIREEMKNGGVYVEGLINSTIYLVPNINTPDKFVMEGFGRWFVIRKTNKQILLSGDSLIRPKEINISDLSVNDTPDSSGNDTPGSSENDTQNVLEKKKIRLDIDFFVTRIPRRPSYYQKSHLAIDIEINASKINKGVFSTNYDAFHKMYLIDKKGKETKIADLKFKKPSSKYKLIDMRGINLIENDYE